GGNACAIGKAGERGGDQRAHNGRRERWRNTKLVAGRHRDNARGYRAGDGHDRADGEAHTRRGECKRHAERHYHQWRAAIDDIDKTAIEPPIAVFKVEKSWSEK